MASRKKKRPSGLPAKPVKATKSFMRPEWRRKIFGEGGPRELPPRNSEESFERNERARKTALPAWLRPFEIWRPTPGQLAERERLRHTSLAPHLIPEAELQYIERMKRGGMPSSSYRPSGGPPPVQPGPRRYGPPPPAARPGAQAAPPPSGAGASPTSVFDLGAVWDGLKRVRSDSRFRGTYGVGQISREGRTQAERAIDVAEFFKVPDETLRRYRPETLWVEWAEPFLKSVADELNHAKPSDIPGRLKFELAENGAFGLVYSE